MSIQRALALTLTEAGLAGFADTADTDTFLGLVPAAPDACLGVFTGPGTTDLGGADDTVQMQVRVRGLPDDPVTPEAVARQVAWFLRDQTRTVWAAGTPDAVLVVRANASPAYDTGRDRNGRHTYAVRVQVRYRAG